MKRKNAKHPFSNLNPMLGIITALALVFISFEWSKSEIAVHVLPEVEIHDFIDYVQIPVTVVKSEPAKQALKVFTLEKLVVVDELNINIEDEIDPIDEPIGSEEAFDMPEIDLGDEIHNEPFINVQVRPVFPGGEKALYQFLADNIKYPEIVREIGVSGRVYVEFVIERDGSVSNIVVRRTPDELLGEEAKRVVEAMPKWTPAIQNGKLVRFRMTLPVNFVLK